MGASNLADQLRPPYYAVVFSSRRTDGDSEGYGRAAARMEELSREQPGFLGIESVRGADGLGITVSYWKTREAIADWKRHIEHLAAQTTGRERWYAHYRLRIARVETDYEFPPQANDPARPLEASGPSL
jgi:heme-degrading monooxygenase HmoA